MTKYEANNFDNKDICCGTCGHWKDYPEEYGFDEKIKACLNQDSANYLCATQEDEVCDDYDGR